MIIKVYGHPDQIIDFKYTGDIKEDVIRENIDEIKRLTLKKITGKENVEYLMTKFKIRKSNQTMNLLPTDFYARKDQEKTKILREVYEILNDPNTTLSLVHVPLSAKHFANGTVYRVGVASKDTHGKKVGGSIHKKSKKKRSRKKKSKRSKKKHKRSKKNQENYIIK